MVKDEKRGREESGEDSDVDSIEIDRDDALDDPPKDGDHKLKNPKRLIFVFALAAIVLTVFGVSFIIGKKIISMNRATVKPAPTATATVPKEEKPAATAKPEVIVSTEKPAVEAPKPETAKPAPKAAVAVPKTEKPATAAKREAVAPAAKHEAAVSAVKPAAVTPKPETAKPAPSAAAKVPKAVKPAAATKRKAVAPAVKPEVIVSTDKPAEEAPKPGAKQKKKPPQEDRKHLKKYKVIVGSFSIKANADSLVHQLKVKKYKPIVVREMTPKGQLYRVIVGSYRSLNVTKAKTAELKKSGFEPFIIFE